LLKSQTASGPRFAEAVIEIVQDITAKYGDVLIRMAAAGDRKELHIRNSKSDFVSEIDKRVHLEYRDRISRVLPSFIYASEEGGPDLHPRRQSRPPSFLAIVDPLDTSELAVRGLFGYTQLTIYSLERQAPVVSVVGDMFHKVQLFYAFQDEYGQHRAYLTTREGIRYPLNVSREKNIKRALLTTYSMRVRERFLKIARRRELLSSLAEADRAGRRRGRLGIDFGSVGLCHVAAGFTDAMVEVARGFHLWDLFPGQHILTAAGGIVTSLDGMKLPLDLDIRSLSDVRRALKRRTKFVAAGQAALLRSILNTLAVDD
jgi:myo-inositol-1(or 4)-monophosphatase